MESETYHYCNNRSKPRKNKYRKNHHKKSHRKSKTPRETRSDNLLEISEKLTDNSYSINRILGENRINDNFNTTMPEYFSQFEAQTFDSYGLPGAQNDTYVTYDKTKLADLERSLSFKEGWTQYNQQDSMTYGVIPDNQLTHDNMVPFFKTKNGYESNDLQNEAVMNFKNELFTGNLKHTWNKKQESKPLFEPMTNLTHAYGTPVMSENERSRYIPRQYRQNEKTFDSIRVTPGLKLKANENGTHGFHPTVRVLEKTIDELRVKPKTTFEGRIIEGQKGQERPLQAPVITYRPETYKTTTEKDLLPTDNVVDGPKTRDNFIMKDTDRIKQHIEYTGGAYTNNDSVGRNVPEYMRSKVKYSDKSTFTLPKPLQKFSKIEAQFNPNLNSYHTSATLKDLTIHNNYAGSANSGSITYANITDAPKTTVKEIISSMPETHTNIASNTMRGTTQPMDIANTTIKEATIENKLNPYAASLNTMQRVYHNDIAKSTVKETTMEPIMPMNATQMSNIYANYMDIAKETIKETMINIPQNMVTPVNQQQRPTDPYDSAKTTIRETTVVMPHQTTLTPINQQQRTPNPSDIAKTTIKETIANIPYQSTITPVNQQQRAHFNGQYQNHYQRNYS